MTCPYLREEIKEEALTRRVDAFARFLEVAALANAQVTNLSSIARDAGVARATVSTYFDILEDTFIGFRLKAWRPSARIKEVGHPKFYLFDTGVARAIQGRLRDAPSAQEMGHLLETYIHHELRAYIAYANSGGQLSYWRTPDGVEVDFVWSRGNRTVAFEVKSSTRWRTSEEKGLTALKAAIPQIECYGIYRGTAVLQRPWGLLLPLDTFLTRLAEGTLLG